MSPMLDIQRRHAEVFRIRLGDKTPTGGPRKLTDSLRITSPNRSVIDAFVEVYGGEPSEWDDQWQAYLPTTELPVMVLPGQSLAQWWELYRKTVCERRCDGFTETLTGTPCKCPADLTVRMQTKGACRPMTRISVICPEVAVVGAGSLVSHGMIAAETLPQSVSVAMAALERGLMVPAVLRTIVHEGKRHYVVPQLEIVGVSLNALTTGEVPMPAIDATAPKAIGSGGGESRDVSATDRSPSRHGLAADAPARPLPPLPGELSPPASGGPTCATCAGPLGTEPIRKQAGQFVHVACPKPSPAAPTSAAGAGDGVERSPAVPSSPQGDVSGGRSPAAGAPPMSDPQRRRLMALCNERGLGDRDARLDFATTHLGRDVGSFGELSRDDAAALMEALEKAPEAPTLLEGV